MADGSPVTLDALQSFLDRYRAVRGHPHNLSFEHVVSAFERARVQLGPLRRRERESERQLAPWFNIFRSLHLSSVERAHSDFLAELLRPDGVHGQGVLFLRAFLLRFAAGATGARLSGAQIEAVYEATAKT